MRSMREQWDRVLAAVLGVVGAVALVLAWAGASNAVFPAKQIPYVVSGGLGGLFLVAATATLWLSADLRDEWRKLDRVEAELSQINGELQRMRAANEGASLETSLNDARPQMGNADAKQWS